MGDKLFHAAAHLLCGYKTAPLIEDALLCGGVETAFEDMPDFDAIALASLFPQ